MKTIMPNALRLCLLTYLAILPVAGTIALRNLLLLASLLILLAWGVSFGRATLRDTPLLRYVPLPLLVWCAFLLLFPFWAVEPDAALLNLKGQWGVSIAAWVVGLGAALMLGRRGPGVGSLAFASAILVGIHLLLTLMAWIGLFGPLTAGFLSWSSQWQALQSTLAAPAGGGWHVQPFPWGFRGFDPMHGNLGYTASQAIVLLIAGLVLALRANKSRMVGAAALGIVLCIFSTVVASSRGAVLFSLLVLLLAVGGYLLRGRAISDGAKWVAPSSGKPYAKWALPLLGMLLILVLAVSLQKDDRWRPMLDGIRVGFMITDPVDFQCNGLTLKDEALIRQRFADKPAGYADELISLLISDSGRIVLMRAGLQMLAEHPWGLDGSRHSYKKLMAARCEYTYVFEFARAQQGYVSEIRTCRYAPVFEFAHAHQGWIDTALALGWGGALLWAWLLVHLLVTGWRSLGREADGPWAWGLFLLSAFWILRGFTDSVYREHYLQMQALLLGYLWGRLMLGTQAFAMGGGSLTSEQGGKCAA